MAAKLRYCCLSIVVLLISCVRPPGEIQVYKTVFERTSDATRASSALLLRARGFSAADEQFRLEHPDGSQFVSTRSLREISDEIAAEAYRVLLDLEARGELESPKASSLFKLRRDMFHIHSELSQIPSDILANESNAAQLLDVLAQTSDFLQEVQQNFSDVRESIHSGAGAGDFFQPLRVMGDPLLAGKDFKAEFEIQGREYMEYYRLNTNQFREHFSKLQKSPAIEKLGLENYSNELNEVLFTICETALNVLANISDSRRMTLAPMRRPGTEHFFLVRMDAAILSVTRNAMKAQEITQEMESTVSHAIKSGALLSADEKKNSDYALRIGHIRVALESATEILAQIRGQKRVRKLMRETGTASTHLSIILKTLYLSKLAGHNRGELLVTCSVKNENNFGDTVYPVIFEENFQAPAFVNRFDRFLYGPTPYTGEMLDLRFTILKLNDLNNRAISSGISAAIGIVKKTNPELSGLSPFIKTLFSTVLTTATENDREFDVSFTIPQPEGDGLPDTDFLLAETGHYILMKREHATRGTSLRQSERQLYRRLVYNPEDGLLYYRRKFQDARANFTAENLFTDQSYAVVVITDEYNRTDTLGDQLREQIAHTLGARRARDVIPDSHDAQAIFDEFRKLISAPPIGSTLTNLGISQATQLKLDLWTEDSDFRRQSITDALFGSATEETRITLGRDPERWKRASLIETNGLLTISPTRATEKLMDFRFEQRIQENSSK